VQHLIKESVYIHFLCIVFVCLNVYFAYIQFNSNIDLFECILFIEPNQMYQLFDILHVC